MSKKTILTGLRANNDLHIGNYFGAMLPTVDMARTHADEYTINMFVPDLHSFTTPIDHTALYQQSIDTARKFIAAGLPLDHDNIHLYRQSFVPAHSELTWILDCFTGMGQMGRMTQYKDKSTKLGDDSTTVGLFNYPVLMAADILLYGANYVPVGDDQTQHLEFARDIAQRMNSKFGELFVVPEPVAKQHEFFGNDQGLRIKDLQNPTKKMSKSDESGRGIVFLGDDPASAAKKIMSAETDSVGVINFDWDNQPGITNLLQILALVTARDQGHVNADWEGKSSYGDLKKTVAGSVEEFLRAYQKVYDLIDDSAVIAKLEASEALMNESANQTLLHVQQAVGLRK
ncbi:MAG: tryptophan--tRNA ligase [Candidatus Saccharimonadales bacterium]